MYWTYQEELSPCEIADVTYVPMDYQLMVLCGEGEDASTLKQVQVGEKDYKIKQVPDIEIQHLTHPFFIDVDLDDNIDILFNDKDGNLMVAEGNGDKFKSPVSFWDNYVSMEDYCYRPSHP